MILKTKMLRILPLNSECLHLLCDDRHRLDSSLGLDQSDTEENGNIKAAYREMYRLCLEHPKDYLWYTSWQIIIKDENKSVGSICFNGTANEKHEVKLNLYFENNYRNQGYETEVLKAVCNWAFSQNVYYIQTQTEANNETFIKTLNQYGFKRIGENEEYLFELEKPASAWMSIYMCLGLSVGMCLGTSFNNISIGMCIGLSVGLALGIALDAEDKKKRKRG